MPAEKDINAFNEAEDWWIYRFIVDERIYFVKREGALLSVGWLRVDGMQFGGSPRVWERWINHVHRYVVTDCKATWRPR